MEQTQTPEQVQHGPQPHVEADKVEVTVEYLPATQPYHQKYTEETGIETVRTQAMAFFGVQDYKDRDNHEFFLEFEKQRLPRDSRTLGQVLGQRKGAKFNLIEQVTQG